ncbi:MAG: porin, partial [Elusimicrobiota bacterium]
ANGVRRRLSPQAYWYPENFGLLGEYVETEQALTRTTGAPATANLTTRSWQVAGSWVLTGEKTSFTGLKPRHPFDPMKGTWGAWELAGRYSALWVDSGAFPRFASPAASSRRADAWTGGVNWYLNSSVRFAANFMQTKLAGGTRDLEQALLTRLQISF